MKNKNIFDVNISRTDIEKTIDEGWQSNHRRWGNQRSYAQKREFAKQMSDISEFCAENDIYQSARGDSYYFEINGQKYRVSNHSPESSHYHNGRDVDTIYINASKLRIKDIYNDLKNGKKLDGKGNVVESIENESIEKHNSLNPKLWNSDDTLVDGVKDAIENIVDEFLNQLEDNDIILIPKDIILLGSNCSYNYTDDSDLDIHIVANGSIDCEQKHLDKLYGAYRSIFNGNMNITIKEVPVEIYVELDEINAKSNGIYSVTNDKWIKKPVNEDIPEVDEEKFNDFFEKWEDKYFELLNNDCTSDYVSDFIDSIYELRKTSISNEGEYGLGNLVFKEFRNLGYLDNLKDLKVEKRSEELSLESLN